MVTDKRLSVMKGDVSMAAAKKTTTVKAVETKAKAPVKIGAAAPAKALETKVEAPGAEEKKAEAETTPVETAPAKKTVKKAAKKTVKTVETANAKAETAAKTAEAEKAATPAKAEKTAEAEKAETPAAKKTVRRAAAKPAAEKKEEGIKASISVQYAGKSYSNEDLMKIARDVWQYDLKKEVKDLKTVELYVKPEENNVYYVFNGTEEGCFGI